MSAPRTAVLSLVVAAAALAGPAPAARAQSASVTIADTAAAAGAFRLNGVTDAFAPFFGVFQSVRVPDAAHPVLTRFRFEVSTATGIVGVRPVVYEVTAFDSFWPPGGRGEQATFWAGAPLAVAPTERTLLGIPTPDLVLSPDRVYWIGLSQLTQTPVGTLDVWYSAGGPGSYGPGSLGYEQLGGRGIVFYEDVRFDATFTTTPEPRAWSLVALGLGALGAGAARTRARRAHTA